MLTEMPALGFGTYGRTGAAGEAAIGHALAAGYRHLDTAQTYGTEAEVGRALRASGVARAAARTTGSAMLSGTGAARLTSENRRASGS